ncbi:acyltransferase [Methylophilaceae bacterium]|nr:acyltransferase [Methylophilaceae bacterium]
MDFKGNINQISFLRGIAVLLVLMYHLEIPYFEQGYLGVDIFFVISGFLMIKILEEQFIRKDRISVWDFIIKRAKRILPAYYLVLILIIPPFFYIYSTDLLESFSTSIIFSLLGISNIYFWSEANYFDSNSFMRPLLHFWSIAVEIQFYILIACVSKFLFKLSYKTRTYIFFYFFIFLNILLILYLNRFSSINVTSDFFYLLHFRLNEFIAGILLYYIYKKININKEGRFFFISGLILSLLIIFFFIDSCLKIQKINEVIIDRFFIILIVSYIILVGKVKYLNNILFINNPLILFFGKISFSLYLIHWPIIVGFKYQNDGFIFFGDKLLILLVCSVLSFLSYIYFENYFRRRKDNKIFYFYIVLVNLIIILLVFSFTILKSYYSQGRFISSDELNLKKDRRFDLIRHGCNLEKIYDNNCQINKSDNIFFYGDSHEPDAYNIFHELYSQNQGVKLISYGSNNICPLKISDQLHSDINSLRCKKRIELLNKKGFINNLDVLVFSFSRPLLPDNYKNFKVINYLKKINPKLKIIILGGYLHTKLHCSILFNKYKSFDYCKKESSLTYSEVKYLDNLNYIKTIIGDFYYINKFNLLCSTNLSDSCKIFANGEPAFYDSHHLSFGFSKYIGTIIKKQLYGDFIDNELPSFETQ